MKIQVKFFGKDSIFSQVLRKRLYYTGCPTKGCDFFNGLICLSLSVFQRTKTIFSALRGWACLVDKGPNSINIFDRRFLLIKYLIEAALEAFIVLVFNFFINNLFSAPVFLKVRKRTLQIPPLKMLLLVPQVENL